MTYVAPVKPNGRIAVLGQGLAGTLVSMHLRENGLRHVIVDRGHASASSRAAAGIVNPVTGRRFVLVPGYADYVANFDIYRRLEALLGVAVLAELTIYRDLDTVKDRNQWDMRREQTAYAPYLGAPVRAGDVGLPNVNLAQWLGPTTGAWRVDLSALIKAYRELAVREGGLVEAEVPPQLVRKGTGTFEIAGSDYGVVVDCRGAGAARTNEWRAHPWRLSKGQAIRLSSDTWPRNSATKLAGDFLAPLGAGDVWYGGTSTDHYDSAAEDAEVRERLVRDASRALGRNLNGSDVESCCAIRPTLYDRRLIVGEHGRLSAHSDADEDAIPNLYACNGFGTKGALVGPSASAELLSILLERLAPS